MARSVQTLEHISPPSSVARASQEHLDCPMRPIILHDCFTHNSMLVSERSGWVRTVAIVLVKRERWLMKPFLDFDSLLGGVCCDRDGFSAFSVVRQTRAC